MSRDSLKEAIGALVDEEFDRQEGLFQKERDEWAAEEKTLRELIEELQKPPVVVQPRLLVGAAMFNNWDKDDGRGTRYDIARLFYGFDKISSSLTKIKSIITNKGKKLFIVSYKATPWSWQQVINGEADADMQKLAMDLSSIALANDCIIEVVVEHEPENNIAGSRPLSEHVASRDAWVKVQRRASKFFKGKPGLRFGIVLMGYYQYKTTEKIYPVWNLDACIPVDAVEFVYFDLYQEYGNAAHPQGYTNPERGVKVLADFCKPKKLRFGLAEAGILKKGFRPGEKGGEFFKYIVPNPVAMIALLRQYGGHVFCYFNTYSKNTTNPDPEISFYMEPGGPRDKAWEQVIVNKESLTTTP